MKSPSTSNSFSDFY
uniref:Eukaryotic translation initiation factor 5A-2 n=1 Tax=Rhizophora mucronata TaxID=61149 RepID=A0A2P2JZP8_RHIMU